MALHLVDVLSGTTLFTRPSQDSKPTLLVGRLQIPPCTAKAVRLGGISRQHFFLEWRRDSAAGAETEVLVLRDNKSVNGIAVNRKRVLESRLRVGDLIAVGLGHHVKVGELAPSQDNVSLRVTAKRRCTSHVLAPVP